MKHRRAQTGVRWVIGAGAVVGTVGLAVVVLRLLRPDVTVTAVVEGPVVESFYATGTVQPVTEYPIRTGTAGLLTEVRVDKGDHVVKGQPLAVVSDPQLQLALDKANAQLVEAQQRADDRNSPVLMEFDSKMQAMGAMLDNATREEQSLNESLTKGASSRVDRDRAVDRVKEHWSELESLKAQRAQTKLRLESELKIAQAAVRAAQTDFDRQTLRSPIDGVVLDRPTPANTRLGLNDHVMQIADVRPDNLVMRAAVDEENVGQVKPGQKVQMTLYSFPGQAFEGKVEKLYDKAEPDRRTFEVDVRLAPPVPALAAGMTGELAFIIAEKDRSLIVPSQAAQGGAIYTVRDGRLTKTDAKIGLRSVERVELTSGLGLGEHVVISSVNGLSDGQRVRTTWTDPTLAADANKPKPREVFRGFN
jgi:HlyD family secretion protein